MFHPSRLLPAVLLAPLVGCRSYQPAPLVPDEILRELERVRDLPESPPVAAGETAVAPGFDELAAWMLHHSPVLALARLEAESAHALTEIPTPLPNPSLGVGVERGLELEPGAPNALVPLVEFGFAVPLSGRLGDEDQVQQLRAEEARTELVLAHRAAYLRLRELYAARLLAHRRFLAREELLEAANRSEAITRQLVEAGSASALDVGLMQLEVTDGEKELLEVREGLAELDASLSALVGIDARHLGEPVDDLERLPRFALPESEAARRLLLEHHHDLSRLRARHAVAEARLRLEVAKQYPDLELGAGYAGEAGENKKVLGLSLGVSLPIFDRNQRGIALAEQERERIRAEYEATLGLALSTLDGLLARRTILEERSRLLEETALPRAEQNVDVAIQSIRAGELNALRVLEVERHLRTLRIEALQVDADLYANAARIEQLIGWPLDASFAENRLTELPDLDAR